MTNLPPSQGPDDPRDDLRAADTDREAVAERLREAAADGRLDLDELQERLDRTFAAKTYRELRPLVADLPEDGGYGPVQRDEDANQPPVVIKGGMGGDERKGYWQVPRNIHVQGGMGGVKLDFTQAKLNGPIVDLSINGEMGGVTVVVPEEWNVELVHSDSGLGGVTNKVTTPPTAGAPLLRATCSGGMGGVTIRHLNRWEQWRMRNSV